MSSFDMLQNFFCSFRELLERVQLHNVPVKQGHGESFEFTSTNISWVPTLYQVPWQVQRWIKKKGKVSFVEILLRYAMCQYHARLKCFSSFHSHNNLPKHHYYNYSGDNGGGGRLPDLPRHSSGDSWSWDLGLSDSEPKVFQCITTWDRMTNNGS